ncbi:MAG: LacI family transcriptional regulator [Prolixibacteraceae bacterium]|nr:LacI family transcriptional regulator [Prolixibacteraceae bacterium]
MNSEKEITIYDIAEKLNLSASTVSRALKGNTVIHESTRQRVCKCAGELGYRSNTFASNLRQKRTHTIGVIVPRLNSNFMSKCLAGMEEVATENGYNLIISQSHESLQKEAENAKTLFNNRVDGLIVSLTVESGKPDHFKPFSEKRVPLVFFDRIPAYNSEACFVTDNMELACDATRHLIDQGCRQLLHITQKSGINVYADRKSGFEKAVKESGISGKTVFIEKMDIDAGRQAANEIMAMKKLPDGIFVSNDAAAIGCMKTLRENGIKIPEQICIVGYNNDPVSTLVTPMLSTVTYPGKEAGARAARYLIDRIEGRKNFSGEKCFIVKSELIVRESSNRKINQ